MEVTRYEVDLNDLAANNEALRQGVEGIHCTLVGSVIHMASDDAKPYLKPGEYVRSIEVYANGAVNLKIARDLLLPNNAYILIRPEAVMLTEV